MRRSGSAPALLPLLLFAAPPAFAGGMHPTACNTGNTPFSRFCPQEPGEPKACNAAGGPDLSSSSAAINVGWVVGNPSGGHPPAVLFSRSEAAAIQGSHATSVRVELRLPAGLHWGKGKKDYPPDCNSPAVKAYQHAIGNAHAEGLQVDLVIDKSFLGWTPENAQGAKQWSNAVTTLLDRCFAGKSGDDSINRIELWNEPNLQTNGAYVDPTVMAEMTADTWRDLQGRHPPVKVGIGGISSNDNCGQNPSGAGCGTDGKGYIAQVFENLRPVDGHYPVDWVGYHPYVNSHGGRVSRCEETNMVAGFYDAYARVTLGKAKGETPPPLDLTEFGWNTDPNASPHNASFGDAAWNIDQFYSELGTRGCVQASYLYKWQDSPSDPSGNEEFSLYDQNGHPRGPMVSAYEKAGAWLRCSAGSAYGKRFGKEVTGPGEGHATIHP